MDDDEDNIPSWKGVTGTIILINAYDQLNNTASIAQDATCLMIKQYLRLSKSHTVGVCLYGIEDTNNSAFYVKSVIEILPLSVPDLDDYKKIRSTDMSTYTQAKELKMSDALWHCSKMFTNCKKQLSSRTVIILSRLDTPPIKSDQNPTLKRVEILVERDIDIKVINISESNYPIDSFYERFLSKANKEKEFGLPEPVWDCKLIEQLMHQQSHRHLAVANLSFEIGNGLSIGVGVFNLLNLSGQSRLKKASLEEESNAIVTSVTKASKVSINTLNPAEGVMDTDDENGPKEMPLLKSEILYYQEYGGKRIEFVDNEMKMLKNPFGPSMLKLLGFKSTTILCKEKWFIKAGYFLFPNENIIEGSTIAFKALHQACTNMLMVAICVLCTRVNARPKIVALSPCTHPLGLDVEIGFNVIHIPFVENVRDIPVVEEDEDIVEIPEAHKAVMKNTLNTIKFDYKPDMFENPKLQSEYRAIEAIALEEDKEEPFVDTTKPNSTKFETLDVNLFERSFGPFGTAPKRAAACENPGTSSKKVKGDTSIDESLLQDRIKNNAVHEYTVPQLKQILQHNKIPELPALTGLKKNELVQLVNKYCVDTKSQ